MVWCMLALLVLISIPFLWWWLVLFIVTLWWWLVLFIVALVLFQNMSGKGSHNGRI